MPQYKYPNKFLKKRKYWYDYGGDLANAKLNQNVQDISAFSKTNGIEGIENLTNAALGFTKPYSEERNKDIGKNIGSAVGVAAGMGLGALGIPPQLAMPVTSALFGAAGEWMGGQISPNRVNLSSINRSIYIPTKEDLTHTQTLNKSNSIQYSMGGNIQQGGFRNLPITQYKGNNHENGGIPLGNTNNEVEGGEVRIGDYIFSDRLFLPNKMTTFAQEAKKLEKKYPNSNGDNISKNAFIREMSQLAQLQETIRNIKQNYENQYENENQYEDENLENQQYAEGGLLNNNNPLPNKFKEFIQKYYNKYKENRKPYKNEILDTDSDEYKVVENFNKQNEGLLENENAPTLNNIDFLKMNQYAKNKINNLAGNSETYDYMRNYVANRGAKYYTPSYEEIINKYNTSLYNNANKRYVNVIPNIENQKYSEKVHGPKRKEEYQQLEDKFGIKTFIQNEEEENSNNNKYAYGGPFKRINISNNLKFKKQPNETDVENFNRLNEQYMNDVTLTQNDKRKFDDKMNQKRDEWDKNHIPTSSFRYYDEAPESIRYLYQSGRIEEAKRLNKEYNKFIDLILDKNGNYSSGPGSLMNLWNGNVHRYKQEFGDIPRQVYVGETQEYKNGGIIKNNITLDNELKKGIEVEKEHNNTLNYVQNYINKFNSLPTKEQFAKSIAIDHIKDYKNINNDKNKSYYSQLIEKNLTDETNEYKEGGSLNPLNISNKNLEFLRQMYNGGYINKMGFGGFKTNDQDPEEARANYDENEEKNKKQNNQKNIIINKEQESKNLQNNFLKGKEYIQYSINPLTINKKNIYANGGIYGKDNDPTNIERKYNDPNYNMNTDIISKNILDNMNYNKNIINKGKDINIDEVYVNGDLRKKNNLNLLDFNPNPKINKINFYNSNINNENNSDLNDLSKSKFDLKENLKIKIPNINWDNLFAKGNVNLDDITNTVKEFAPYALSELGGLYDIYRGLQGGVPESYGRLPYLNLNKLDPTQSIREIREQGNYAQNAVKNMGNLGYSQYLNNINNIRQNTGKQVGNLVSQYDNANNSILNQNKLQNLQTLEKNIQYDIAQNDINARERDEAQNTLQRGFTALGKGINQYNIDKNAKLSQDVILQLMETKDFVPQLSIVDKEGKKRTIMAKKIIHPSTGKIYYVDKNNDIYDSKGTYYSDFNTFLNKE